MIRKWRVKGRPYLRELSKRNRKFVKQPFKSDGRNLEMICNVQDFTLVKNIDKYYLIKFILIKIYINIG